MVFQSACGGAEPLKPALSSSPPLPTESNGTLTAVEKMGDLTIETDDSFSTLLELAANDDLDGFKRAVDKDPAAADEVGLWYCRRKGSSQMVLQQRTPLMVAATYGSLDILEHIVSSGTADVSRRCGSDETSALHCAASGGAVNAVDAVKILLFAGADPNCTDSNGRRAFDVIVVSPRTPEVKRALEHLLACDDHGGRIPEEESSKKEYPVDPTLPDIKNSIYSTDEFRMFSCKVQPCSRAYSHDWTECPFAHPGENARRRDPRKFHYSCVPCPDFRKGLCRRGDMCEYAHGVFECYLHPAQYRTRPCKEGTSCTRRVCFFAHTPDELRPVYGVTGSALPSPRAAMDMATAMNLLPGSPSALSSPALHLPMSNLQSSRLRASFNARDIHTDDEYAWRKAANLDELFAAEMPLSPRYNSDAAQKSALLNQLQQLHQQQQSLLSPIKTNVYSPKSDLQHSSLLQASLGIASPGRMSPRSGMEPQPLSPMGSRLSAFAQLEKQQQPFRSLSSRDLGAGMSPIVGSPVNSSLADWASPSGKLDWAMNGEEISRLRQSNAFESAMHSNADEPDVSWVQSLVKETMPETTGKLGGGGEDDGFNADMNNLDVHFDRREN